jgi:periplasmic protein CpxP/Spy
MSKLSSLTLHAGALAILVGGIAISAPSFAASSANGLPLRSEPSSIVLGQAAPDSDSDMAAPAPTSTSKKSMHHHDMKMSPEMMQEHVENRIKTLHTKLMITPDQESKWNDVAEAMRNSEKQIGDLIKERHEKAGTLTAVEDLQSYQSIAQAHADGLKNVVSSFDDLYETMSDDQKKNADKVFGTFEGHDGMMHGKHTKKMSK